ncbi:MAG: hypothetical protein A2V98_16440 [Planctomycetes bacterium RBG_16_64_12]|nr:MAG: hypothetical protein A2V98_16440 [Planctomycetes bacterium RBG_16_64_12]
MDEAIDKIEGIGVYLAPRPLITVLGVKYLHLRVEDGTDLYVTEHGLPFTKCLMPENHWADDAWMKAHSVRLPGTSASHRVTTKQVDGRAKEIVVKWNRMGQDIPGDTRAVDAGEAEFNSPFMEFSLVLELRDTRFESPGRLYTHKPLAIYVPRKYVQAEQLGRRRHKMEAIERSHDEIPIDWNRNYAVIYEWIKGIDAVEAWREGLLDNAAMAGLVQRANADLNNKGFAVSDNKPQHLIVRPAPDGQLMKDRTGKPLYGMVDFELLKRTPSREESLRAAKRHDYLVRQAHRFEPREQFPSGLTPMTIMGVDYVYGQVESTGGALWVVGRDPVLFDYFLPEKWRRTPRTRLSASYEIYDTVTKDNVHLVWRVSRVGQIPDADPFVRREKCILDHGYNSPFEEFSIAMELSSQGIETTYPRAIYMTGHRSSVSSSLVDNSRYKSHASQQTPEAHPILSRHREYLTIWGYWNGPDDALAVKDEVLYKGIDALAAYREGRLTQRGYVRIVQAAKRRLAAAGVEDLSLRGNHLLLSIDRRQELAVDEKGLPLIRVCNFELLKRR